MGIGRWSDDGGEFPSNDLRSNKVEHTRTIISPRELPYSDISPLSFGIPIFLSSEQLVSDIGRIDEGVGVKEKLSLKYE
jgi:hypothetical protein